MGDWNARQPCCGIYYLLKKDLELAVSLSLSTHVEYAAQRVSPGREQRRW